MVGGRTEDNAADAETPKTPHLASPSQPPALVDTTPPPSVIIAVRDINGKLCRILAEGTDGIYSTLSRPPEEDQRLESTRTQRHLLIGPLHQHPWEAKTV